MADDASNLISGVAHLGIRVHDLAESRAFYEKLGFAISRLVERHRSAPGFLELV